jgi:similar to stage IV sporulation protein
MRRAGIINYICGYYILRVRDRAAFANLLLEQGIFTWNPVLHDGCVTLYMLRSEYSRMVIPDKIDVEVVREVGLPHLLHRYRHRPGILAGLLLFIATLCISSMFIWNVEIEGAENIPEEEIIGKLEELGCGVGSFIPSIDFYALCNRYLAYR